MRARLNKIKQYWRLRKSGLFDAGFYLNKNEDVRKADIDPLWHFINHGWKEGRDPSPYFSVDYYLEHNPDVVKSGFNPVLHYLLHGAIEGRDPSPDFSTEFYLKQNPDVADAGINPLAHYIVHGRREGRSPKLQESAAMLDSNTANCSVSIIIPVYNALVYTKSCLNALFSQVEEVDFEVIVINNASNDETKNWLEEIKKTYTRLKVIHNDINQGFAPAVNQGLLLATGKYFVILNNDTIPAPGWLSKLVKAANDAPAYGILSPITNYVGEGPQLAQEAKDLTPEEIAGFAVKISENDTIVEELWRLVFFCVLIKRDVVDLIGLLDEGYRRGNFEDDDYCFRTRIAGFKLGIVQSAFVFHHGSATFKANAMNYSTYYEENRKRYYLKVSRYASRPPLESRDVKLPKREHEPSVSVVVRTVNRPETLRVALNSLVHQVYKDFEVVLVNDGGPDLGSLLAEYASFLDIKYVFHEKSKGRTAALNAGLGASTGQWVCYLDDDDLYYPWHLAVMYQASQQKTDINFFFGLHNRALIDTEINLEPIESKPGSIVHYSREKLLLGNFIPINTWFHARNIAHRGFDESFDTLEDYEFLLHLSENNHFEMVSVPVCEYRFYLSQSNSIARLREDTYIALQRLYELYIPKDEWVVSSRKEILNAHRIQMVLVRQAMTDLASLTDSEKRSRFREILTIVGAI